jgi:hypothetical protein
MMTNDETARKSAAAANAAGARMFANLTAGAFAQHARDLSRRDVRADIAPARTALARLADAAAAAGYALEILTGRDAHGIGSRIEEAAGAADQAAAILESLGTQCLDVDVFTQSSIASWYAASRYTHPLLHDAITAGLPPSSWDLFVGHALIDAHAALVDAAIAAVQEDGDPREAVRKALACLDVSPTR